MKRISGEDAQELIEDYCLGCKYHIIFDIDSMAGECIKDYNVVYNYDEECVECKDFCHRPLDTDGYLGLYDHKIDGEWY